MGKVLSLLFGLVLFFGNVYSTQVNSADINVSEQDNDNGKKIYLFKYSSFVKEFSDIYLLRLEQVEKNVLKLKEKGFTHIALNIPSRYQEYLDKLDFDSPDIENNLRYIDSYLSSDEIIIFAKRLGLNILLIGTNYNNMDLYEGYHMASIIYGEIKKNSNLKIIALVDDNHVLNDHSLLQKIDYQKEGSYTKYMYRDVTNLYFALLNIFGTKTKLDKILDIVYDQEEFKKIVLSK